MPMIRCDIWSGTTGTPAHWEDSIIQSRYIVTVRPGRPVDTTPTKEILLITGIILRVKADTFPDLTKPEPEGGSKKVGRGRAMGPLPRAAQDPTAF